MIARFLRAVILFSCVVLNGSNAPVLAQNQVQRVVQGNTLISTALPNIRIRIDRAFRYVGKIDFKIRDVAQGERYIFVESQDKVITRMFIAQFEGFLSNNAMTYNYSFQNALDLNGHRFKQNTFAYSNKEARTKNPTGEAALTAAFLRENGLALEDELMMSRFVTVPDSERRHELILFYVENASSTGRRLQEFYERDTETEVWKELSKTLTAKSLKNFEILQ